MNIGTSVRLFLARRPWIYWIAVSMLALVVAFGVAGRLAAVDESRNSWEDTRRVWVATHDLEPGDVADVTAVDLPVAAVPPAALDPTGPPAVVRQRIRRGEVLVDADVVVGHGPAAAADPGQVVVPIGDPLLVTADVGVDVAVYAEGVVLAERGRVVGVIGEVILVAVEAADGPMVAAAAQTRSASIVFIR